MINIRKRGKVYQYCFEAGKVMVKESKSQNVVLELKMKLLLLGKKHIMNLLMVRVPQNVICYILII